MVVSHIGNWELFAPDQSRRLSCKAGAIYQRLGNRLPRRGCAAQTARGSAWSYSSGRKDSARLRSSFATAGRCGVLVDQHAGDAGLWCPFFGRLASTSTLAATLALAHRQRRSCRPPFTPTGVGPLAGRVPSPDRAARARRRAAHRADQRRARTTDATCSRPTGSGCTIDGKRRSRNSCSRPTSAACVCSERTARLSAAVSHASFATSNWLGDAVMSVPAVRAIKRGRPDAHSPS